MATKNMAYDHPEYQTTKAATFYVGTAAASAVAAKFALLGAARVKKVSCFVGAAGTNTGAGYEVLAGTATLGTFQPGTNAVGYECTALTPAASLAGTATTVTINTLSASTLLTGCFTVEYDLIPGASVTS